MNLGKVPDKDSKEESQKPEANSDTNDSGLR